MKVASFPTTNLVSMAEGLIEDYRIPLSQYETGIRDFIRLIKTNEAYMLKHGRGLQDVTIVEVDV